MQLHDNRAPNAVMVSLCLLLTSSLLLINSGALARDVELTFDDQESGTGAETGHAELDNLEQNAAQLGDGLAVATLTGTARRSGIDEGRYGRAAEFPGGGGAIELANWQMARSKTFFLWLAPRDTSSGYIARHEGSWELRLDDGELVAGVVDPTSGSVVDYPTGLMWPADSGFHHLVFMTEASGSGVAVTVVIDFADPARVESDFVPAPSTAPLRLAEGFDGLLDELMIRGGGMPNDTDRMDFDPLYCPTGASCLEETLHMTPRDFPHEVPVRFKTGFDPSTCTAESPCPLAFEISGGNNCADDYAGAWSVAAIGRAGFVVVTVDLYCEGDDDTMTFPTETSQLIAVKNYVLDEGPFRDLIAGPEYAATGCSHGAGTVAAWAMHEDDHPARTFSRSTAGSGVCGVVAGVICPAVASYYEERFDGELDLEDPRLRGFHESSDLVGLITPEIAASREIARSWGVNTEGNLCNADGTHACNEDGQWGMTYASRRFRDVWEAAQPPGAATGYFVEDQGADCRHCAPPGSAAFDCGLCMMRYGRLGMESSCPQCLSYDDASIDRGGEAEMCPIDASWYTDPLPEPAAAADAGVVAPPAGDAGVSPPVDPPADSSGCSAAATPTPSSAWALGLVVGLLWWRRRR